MSSEVIIRGARLSDAQYITDLNDQLGYPSTIEGVKDRLTEMLNSDSHEIYVAEIENEKVVGWIHVFGAIRLESSRFAELGGLIVSSEMRGRKIGEKLVDKAENWAKEKGYTKIRVRCQVKRERAHNFYEKENYSLIKDQKVFEKVL